LPVLTEQGTACIMVTQAALSITKFSLATVHWGFPAQNKGLASLPHKRPWALGSIIYLKHVLSIFLRCYHSQAFGTEGIATKSLNPSIHPRLNSFVWCENTVLSNDHVWFAGRCMKRFRVLGYLCHLDNLSGLHLYLYSIHLSSAGVHSVRF